MASSSSLHEAGMPQGEAGPSSSSPSMQSMGFAPGSIPVGQAPGMPSPWQMGGVPLHAGETLLDTRPSSGVSATCLTHSCVCAADDIRTGTRLDSKTIS